MNIRHFGFLLILVLTMILCPDAEANNHRSILVLHSYHRGFAWDDSIDKGIANIFATHPDVAIRTEYMDTKRINDEEYYSILLKTFKHKFAGLHFDVVISIDNNALNFLTKHRDELFPDTPVAFCGVNNFDPAMLAGTQGFTGATESIAVQETLEAALKLDSDVKHVYIFGANTSTYHGNKAMFLQAIPEFEGRLEFIFNDEVKIPQAIEILKEAPSNSIAFVIAFLRDRNGEFVTFEEACDTISKKTKIPLYGLWDYLLGHGVVGGLVISGLAQGETAAQIALDIMNGKPVDKIPFLLTSPNRYMFDYQQLNRFDFNSDRLPAKSTIINLPNSFYSNYKELIWVVISCAIGLLTIIIILILNILSRKRAEAQYRTTLESMNDIIHVVDSDFNLVLVNQAFEQQANSLGIEGNVTGRNLFELFPFLSEKIHKEYGKVIDNGKLVASEEMTTIQGKDLYTETRKIPILSSNRVNQIITVVRDITVRKKTEEALKESKENFQAIVENTENAVTVLDTKGNFLYTNENSAKNLGLKPNELNGKSVYDFFPKEFADGRVETLRKVVESQKVDSHLIETPMDGDSVSFRSDMIPFRYDGKEAVLTVSTDITDIIETQKALKASLREKETLLHEIHHRVKNNMQVINSLLKLQSNSIEDAKTKEILKDSQSRVYAMSAVHETLHGSESLSEINLQSYLSKITTSIFQTYSTDSRRIQLNSDINNSPIVLNQAYPLGLIINELISNSLKYAFPDEREGKISVSLKKHDKELELTIMDDGVGIPDSFDWKNSKSLGLKLVRTLVENQLDGSIEMESNNGTKFTIKFKIDNT